MPTMTIKPDLQLTSAAAQSIIDAVAPGQTVTTVSNIHGGEIAAVHEITFAEDAQPPLVLKVYGARDRDHVRAALDLYHLYFVLELWCWMAEIGNGNRSRSSPWIWKSASGPKTLPIKAAAKETRGPTRTLTPPCAPSAGTPRRRA
jgi:hypothetical protein